MTPDRPGPYLRRRGTRPARGAAIFTYILVGGLAMGAAVGVIGDYSVTRTAARGDAMVAQEAALIREFAAAAATHAVTLTARIEETYRANLLTMTAASAQTARAAELGASVTITPSALVTAGVLRNNFPAVLPSGSSLTATLAQRIGPTGALPVQDLYLWTNGYSTTLYGRQGGQERAASARLRVVDALRREPPATDAHYSDGARIGLIRPGTATLGAEGAEPIDLSRFNYLAASGNGSIPQLGIYIGAPGQQGYWVISLASRVSSQPQDCRATPAGGGAGAPIYRCSPDVGVVDTTVAANYCSFEEAQCQAQDIASPGAYDACRAQYAGQGVSMPAVRSGTCQASPYCSFELAEWTATNNPSACFARTPLQCADGAARRITLTQVEARIGDLGFSYTCPESATLVTQASLAGGSRRWGTTQEQSPITVACFPQYRHGVQNWLRAPARDVISQNYSAIGSLIPQSITYDTDGRLLGGERFLTVTGSGNVPPGGRGLRASWDAIADPYGPVVHGSIYPRDEVNFCVGPILEQAAPGTGPTEGNLPIPNVALANHMVIPTQDRSGNFLVYAFGTSFITDRPGSDPRAVRTFSDWTLSGISSPTDVFQAPRQDAFEAFNPTMRMNAYSEQGITFSPGSTAAPIEIRVPYNPPASQAASTIPPNCGPYSGASIRDLYGTIRPRSYRDGDASTGCPPVGDPWRLQLVP